MVRPLSGLLLALAAVGCAGPATQTREPELNPRLDRVELAQAKIDARLDELARNLLALRERLGAQEAALAQVQAQTPKPKEEAVPPLRVVKLEPPRAEVPAVPGGAAAAPTEPPPGSPEADLFRRGFSAYRERRCGPAILDFEEFLRRYPEHPYGQNAQYWVGECYYSQGEYAQAVVEFGRVLDRYPGDAKASDALLKLSLAYDKLGEADKARVFRARLLERYPESEAARQVRAEAKP